MFCNFNCLVDCHDRRDIKRENNFVDTNFENSSVDVRDFLNRPFRRVFLNDFDYFFAIFQNPGEKIICKIFVPKFWGKFSKHAFQYLLRIPSSKPVYKQRLHNTCSCEVSVACHFK